MLKNKVIKILNLLNLFRRRNWPVMKIMDNNLKVNQIRTAILFSKQSLCLVPLVSISFHITTECNVEF